MRVSASRSRSPPDFTLAADDARFWQPFIERGFTPDSGAAWLLSRKAGPTLARDLLMLGRKLSGAEAATHGLVHAAHSAVELDAHVTSLLEQLANGPTVALGLTKWLLHEADAGALHDALRRDAFALELSSRSEDFREGLKAFKERRGPDFTGR